MTLRLRVGIAAWFLLAGLTSLSTSGDAATTIASSSECNGVYDPYSATEEFLAACGVTAYPLVKTESLPDGGKSYFYDVNGDVGWTNVPPAGFDPSTADAAELELYGYPERPSGGNGADVTAWANLVGNIKVVDPPATLYSVPMVRFTSVVTLNWAGYNTTNYTFTKAALTYNVSEATGQPTPPCTHGPIGTWTGLGGVNTLNLAQNGTAIGSPGLNYN